MDEAKISCAQPAQALVVDAGTDGTGERDLRVCRVSAPVGDCVVDPAERIHQPALAGGDYGQASDIEIQANEVLRMRAWLEETWAKHSGRDVEQVRKDIERDKILTAAEAKDYGLIDEVLASRKASLDD